MNNLVLHVVTRKQLNDFIGAPSHAVMIVGPSGSGKSTLAEQLVETVLSLPVGSFGNYPYKMLITSEGGQAIGIEAIRQLEHFLSLKVPSSAAYDRSVLIENAHNLTVEAQNALLKTLEEPPAGTLIILNASHGRALLPTIRSRTQIITIKRPGQSNTAEYFKAQGYSEQQIVQAYAISGGLPGLMSALLDQADHPLLEATEQARKLLSTASHDRLLLVDELSKNRPLVSDTLFILQQMARVSLRSATGQAAKKWQAVLVSSFKAAEALERNGQAKLVLTSLCLSF